MTPRIAWIFLLLLPTLLACKKTDPAEAPAPPPASEVKLPARSKGFQKPKPPPPARPYTQQEQAKIATLTEQKAAHQQDQIPPQMVDRPQPRATNPELAFDIYRDGVLVRSVRNDELETPVSLASFSDLNQAPAQLRSVLVYGATGHLWLSSAQVEGLRLRINQKGLVKLEPSPDISSKQRRRGLNKSAAAGKGISKRQMREAEVRGVHWIELRSLSSPTLDSEP